MQKTEEQGMPESKKTKGPVVYRYRVSTDCCHKGGYYRQGDIISFEESALDKDDLPPRWLIPLNGGPTKPGGPSPSSGRTPMLPVERSPSTLSEMSARSGQPLGAPRAKPESKPKTEK
jgi:hypothetical protein